MTILISGAPGNVGTPLVRALRGAVDFRVAAWDMEQARAALGDDLDMIHFDFTDPTTFRQAFAGIKRLFLVRPPALSNVERDITPAIYAALGAGVQHIVFLSIQGVENNKRVPHYKIEQLIRSLGVDFTFLRAGFFMQNLSTTHAAEIRDEDKIAVPVGKAKTAFVDARDLAAVAARTLTEDGHANQSYTLTGDEALDYYQVADILSAALNRRIVYTNPSAPWFWWRQVRGGMRWQFALVVTMLYTITRFGNGARVSDDVARLLGRPPLSLAQFAADYRACW